MDYPFMVVLCIHTQLGCQKQKRKDIIFGWKLIQFLDDFFALVRVVTEWYGFDCWNQSILSFHMIYGLSWNKRQKLYYLCYWCAKHNYEIHDSCCCMMFLILFDVFEIRLGGTKPGTGVFRDIYLDIVLFTNCTLDGVADSRMRW